MKRPYLTFGAAIISALTVFTASLYLFGVPTRFPIFLLRSLTIILGVFALTFTAIQHPIWKQ